MRDYIRIIENAIKITEKDKKITVNQTVNTPVGKGTIIDIETEDKIDNQRSLTGHLGSSDKRVRKRAKIKFNDGSTQWFPLFQLNNI